MLKFSCEKDALAEGIAAAGRAVSPKSTYPALEGLLLSASEDGLRMTGYNLEIGITHICEADVHVPGAGIVNARYFSDIVRKLPNDRILVEIDDDNGIAIRCGFAKFDLLAMPAEEFPELPVVESSQSLSISAGVLKSMISEAVYAVSTSEHKPVLTGALFDVLDGALRVVATDGNRLALREEKVDHGQNPFRFIVPAATLREVERLTKDEDKTITLQLSRKHITMEFGQTRLISRLLEGDFYKYENALTVQPANELLISVDDFTESLERVSLLINEKMKNAVRCYFEHNMIKLTYVSTIGRAYDECRAEGSVQAMEIGLSNRYLLDALHSIRDEKAIIAFNAPHAPFIIRPVEDTKFFHMIAPVRLS